jgi:hypothetical protein
MNIQTLRDWRIRRSGTKSILLGTAATVALLLTGIVPTRADEHMVLVDKIAVPPGNLPSPVCVPGTGLGTFDISFADTKTDLYVLSDRTNGAVDFFDASDDTFIGRVGGFAGVVCTAATATTPSAANNSKSGPDGVVIIGNQVWAGDGDSTLKVIDISLFKIVDTIPVTDPTDKTVKLRVDEMAYDANDHILAAANNANVPPFVTLVNTDTHQILGQIVFDGSGGTPNATNTGIEQAQWSPKTGLFYVSIPNIDPKDDSSGFVSVIDPTAMKVMANYPVPNCGPAGLALGPRHEAIVGCGGSFGTPPTTQTVIINLDNGDILANITQAGGNDEVWFDPGTQHYYLSARGTLNSSGKVTPILGTVDARTFEFDGSNPTSTTAHSVAADKRSHHVFVPIGYVPSNAPGTDTTNPCPEHGCIAVYLPSSVDDDDLGARLAKR